MSESEIVVFRGDPDIASEITKVEAGRLSLIGCVDLEWITGHYPMPLFAIDQTLGVEPVHYDDHTIYRVKGLMPTYRDPKELMTGAWEAWVDLPAGPLSGKGSVYMGQGEETTGHIFDRQMPFNSEFELGYVRDEVRNHQVILTERLYGEPYSLIYAQPDVLDNHDRLAIN